jgi:integrase
MASIRKRKKKDGTITYYAEIVIKRKGEILHREGRTFLKQSLAKTWSAKRELELQQQEVFGGQRMLIIADLIKEYLDRFDAGRSKGFDLRRMIDTEIAQKNIYKLNSADIIKHCTERAKTSKPQTVKNDVIWIKSALATMKGVHNYDYSLEMFESANIVMRKEGLIASSDKRTRRPTNEELWKLSRALSTKGWGAPYLHIMWFAIFSARRLSEICKLRWSDINHENRTILVRDMKTPNKKPLNLRAKLPIPAYKLIIRQPKTHDRIFPYQPKTISAIFTKTCRQLAINDLHFHDLRREACSRLAERGFGVDDIAMISLHQSWNSLRVYHEPDPGKLDI